MTTALELGTIERVEYSGGVANLRRETFTPWLADFEH